MDVASARPAQMPRDDETGERDRVEVAEGEPPAEHAVAGREVERQPDAERAQKPAGVEGGPNLGHFDAAGCWLQALMMQTPDETVQNLGGAADGHRPVFGETMLRPSDGPSRSFRTAA